MSVRSKLPALAAALVAACATGPGFVDQMQPQAIDLALRRGQFEMNCPEAAAELLSRETVQPRTQTLAYMGPQRAEYTVDVAGCHQRNTYIVICPDNGTNSCFAGGSRYVVR
jgi:hypothetical protein